MGSSPSSSGGGGTLSGGKTMLAGTFLAEQTHSNPASYTLVSVGALSESSRNNPRVQGGSSGGSSGSRSKMNRSRVEKSGPHCTKLSALDEIDSLLLKDEETPQSERRARSKTVSNKSAKVTVGDLPGIPVTSSKSKSMAEQLRLDVLPPSTSGRPSQCGKPGDLEDKPLVEHATDEALPHLSSAKPGRTSKTPLQSRGAFLAPATNDDLESAAPVSSVAEPDAPSTSHGRLDSRPSSQKKPRISQKSPSWESTQIEKAEVHNRLYICRKPWVADESDSQLLQYLATRGGTPEITSQTALTSPTASISRSGDVSTSLLASTSLQSTSLLASTSLQMSTRSSRSKYRNHRELFDTCLHRDPSPEIRATSAGLSPRQSRGAKMNKNTGAFSSRGGPASRLLYSPKQLAAAQASREKSGTIQEKIKEIVPILEARELVEAFSEAEGTTSPLYSPKFPASHRAWGASPGASPVAA